MIEPLVSVLIPAYNASKTIERTINSVLNQTYLNYEILVVDDCSTDNTADIIKKLFLNKIKFIQHEKNMGEADSRNTLIKNAKGEFFAWLDSDDEWIKKKLEIQIDYMLMNHLEVSMTGFNLTNKYLYNDKVVKFSDVSFIDLKYVVTNGSHSTALFTTLIISKKLVNNIGIIPSNYLLYVDWHYLLNITNLTNISVLNMPLSNVFFSFSKGSKSLFNSSKNLINNNKKILKNLSLLLRFKFYSLVYRDIASVYFDDKKFFSSFVIYLFSFLLNPRFPSMIFYKRIGKFYYNNQK